jgi:hypothetical protein
MRLERLELLLAGFALAIVTGKRGFDRLCRSYLVSGERRIQDLERGVVQLLIVRLEREKPRGAAAVF